MKEKEIGDMKDNLHTISNLFTERLFRIPDYQRGYAWTSSQLEDYWSDIMQIEGAANHYTGALMLEDVSNAIYAAWEDDKWIIESRNYKPFYIVDGQQRLTTSIILINCIIETMKDDEDQINYTTKKEIQKRFLFDSPDRGVSRSYIFGYEKDNPSYEYLKTKIFMEVSSSDRSEETIYTNNLQNAKLFFSDKIALLDREGIEEIYKKITQKLIFNVFTISNDVDVCMAFETMNNRGKPLSHLELLKNRLIFLSIKLSIDESEAKYLRKIINDCWKDIYHYLGKNKLKPLDDDFFLKTHHFLNFVIPMNHNADELEKAKARRHIISSIADPHYEDLLGKIFTINSLAEERKNRPEADDQFLLKMSEYSLSLKKSVSLWYRIHNPINSNNVSEFDHWLQKINRLNNKMAYPIALAIMCSSEDNNAITTALIELERLVFLSGLVSQYYLFTMPIITILDKCTALHRRAITLETFTSSIRSETEKFFSAGETNKNIRDYLRNKNYYSWKSVHYLLFEYNLDIQMKSKTEREKIKWDSFTESEEDYKSIEHIYPQQARNAYWKENFPNLNPSQRETLKNVIGNLLPLSRQKNSSLSNGSYPDKAKGKGNSVAYCYGSYAENEVSEKYTDWNPQTILDRSLHILDFIEARWGINLGKDSEKVAMLGLGFVKPSDRIYPKVYSAVDSYNQKNSSKRQKAPHAADKVIADDNRS